jgi:hypothetical protein
MGYTKLFSSIIASTIWREDDKTRIVWITLLAMADKNGEVQASLPGLADFARVSIAEAQTALAKLSSPDEHSHSKIDEGRRIEAIDGGWFLINHAYYRAKASKDESKSASAIRQKRYRERMKRNGCHDVTDSVTHDRDIADADSEADKKGKGRRFGFKVGGKINQAWPPAGHPLDEPYHRAE